MYSSNIEQTTQKLKKNKKNYFLSHISSKRFIDSKLSRERMLIKTRLTV